MKRTDLVLSSSISVYDPGCEVCRVLFAYIGFFTPSVLLLTLLTFYDAKSTLCSKFPSTFLLNNTQPPSEKHLPTNKTVTKEFTSFHTKFFSDKDIDEEYHFYDENYNYEYYLKQSNASDNSAWENHLGDLSIANKHFLMKALRTNGTLHTLGHYSRDYYHRILTSFNSIYLTENFLSLLREFGFLNFCSEKILLKTNRRMRSDEVFLDVVIEGNPTSESSSGVLGAQNEDSWWRGYSPYDVDYSDDLETLFDALLVFEGDPRFSEHLVCWSKIFDIDQAVLHRDFNNLRDLKESKKIMINRTTNDYDGMASFDFGKALIIKLFNDYWPSLPMIDEDVLLRYEELTGGICLLETDEFRTNKRERTEQLTNLRAHIGMYMIAHVIANLADLGEDNVRIRVVIIQAIFRTE